MSWDAIPERATADEGTRTSHAQPCPEAMVVGVEAGRQVGVTDQKKVEGVYTKVFGLMGSTAR